MKKNLLIAVGMLCFTVGAAASDFDFELKAELRGINEVPPIASNATGSFRATPNSDGTFSFTLRFSGLAANASVAHIHFGQKKVAGGVMIFLCGGGNQPACPAATSGTVTGTFSAANVTGPMAQGIAPGDFVTAVRQIFKDATYVNVHNATFPAGEIRGQVDVRRHHGGDGD
jgi:CHRD domain